MVRGTSALVWFHVGQPAFTLVEDVHTWLVCADGFQDFGVGRKNPDDVSVVFQQPLRCLYLRDAFWLYQPVLYFRLGGPVEGGVVDLCTGRGTGLEYPPRAAAGSAALPVSLPGHVTHRFQPSRLLHTTIHK